VSGTPTAVVGNGTVKFTWNAATNATMGITGYQVLNSTTGVTVCSAAATATTCTATASAAGLSTGAAYVFTVVALNAAGYTAYTSTASTVISASPASAGTVTAAVNATYTALNFAFTPSTSNGLGGSTVAYIALNNAGTAYTCTITALGCSMAFGAAPTGAGTAASPYATYPLSTTTPYNGYFQIVAINSQGATSTPVASNQVVLNTPPSWGTAAIASAVNDAAGALTATITTPSQLANGNTTDLVTSVVWTLWTCPTATFALTGVNACTSGATKTTVGNAAAIGALGATTTKSFYGLTVGTYYAVTASAVTDAGSALLAPSTAVKFTSASAGGVAEPSLPVVSVTSDNSSISATWTPAVVGAGASAVTSYTVTLWTGTTCAQAYDNVVYSPTCATWTAGSTAGVNLITTTATATTQKFSGLPAGYYTVTVVANNAAGASNSINSGGIITAQSATLTANEGSAATIGALTSGFDISHAVVIAGAPRIRDVYTSGTSITVSYSASHTSNWQGDYTPTTWFVVDHNATLGDVVVCTSTTSTCTFSASKLASATEQLRVFSTDAAGYNSAVSASWTLAAVAAPVSVIAVPVSSTSEAIYWTPSACSAGASMDPNPVGGLLISGNCANGYNLVATASSGARITASTTVSAADSGTSYLFTGLNPLLTYTFSVQAFVATGNSAFVNATYVVLPAHVTVPPTPTTIVKTSPSSTSLSFTWSDGLVASDVLNPFDTTASTGFGAVKGVNASLSYTGTLTDAAGKTVVCTGASASTGCTFTGLTPGAAYTFSVVANSLIGNSAALTASLQVPVSAPGASSGVTVTSSATGTGITVSWTAPTNNGGSPISGYTVTAVDSTSSIASVTTTSSFAAAASSITVANPTGIAVGQSVSGNGIPGSTVVTSVSGSTIGLSNATATASTTSVTNTAAGTAASITVSTGSAALLQVGDIVTGFGATSGVAITAINPGTGVVTLASSISSSATAYTVTRTLTFGSGCRTTSTTCSFAGLTAGDVVTVSVVANNAAGAGTAAYGQIKTNAAPSSPTAVTATAGNGTIIVGWSSPLLTNGAAVTSYTANVYAAADTTYTTSLGSCTTTAMTCTISAISGTLTAGTTSLIVTVKATNTAGTGAVGTPAAGAVTYSAVPGIPTGVIYYGSSVGWVAPTSVGNAAGITGYTVTAIGNSGSPIVATVAVTDSNPSPNSYTFTGLTAGVTYSFQVAAVNSVGSSAASTAVLANALPSAPAAVIVNNTAAGIQVLAVCSAGCGTALPVTFNISALDTATNVVTTVLGAGALTTFGFGTGAGQLASVNHTYTFTVNTVSAFGVSSASTSESSAYETSGSTAGKITTFNAVTVPGYVSTVAGAYSATSGVETVTWNAPSSITNGDGTAMPVLNYAVTLTSPTGVATSCVSVSTTCHIVGLLPNTVYLVTIVANNIAGGSLPYNAYVTTGSAAAYTSITGVTATASTSVVAGANAYAVVVSWTPATNLLGYAVTGYIVSATDTTGSVTTYCTTTLTAASSTCAVPVAAAGDKYYATVVAILQNGATTVPTTTLSSGYVNMITAAKAPTIISAVPGAAGSIVVTWAAGYDTLATTSGNSSITGFIATAELPGLASVSCSAPATANSCTITGVPYSLVGTYESGINVYVTEKNVQTDNDIASGYVNTSAGDNGDLIATSTSGATVLSYSSLMGTSDAPIIASAVSGSTPGSIVITWVASGANGAWAPVSYTATVGTASCTATAPALTCTVTGLANATTYPVSVVATNVNGVGAVAGGVTAKTVAVTTASAPTISGVVTSSTGLQVTWAAPVTTGGYPVLGYVVSATDNLSGQQFTCPVNATYGLVLAPAVTCPINGLMVGNVYTIAVQAVTAAGVGAKATQTATFAGVNPEPVMATFLAVTAKQKSVSALSPAAKTALSGLISSTNDGAQITITGYGTTKAIALARANAAASYLFNNGAAVHVTIASVISKTVKTALVTVTSN